jgi:hypothetical protein
MNDELHAPCFVEEAFQHDGLLEGRQPNAAAPAARYSMSCSAAARKSIPISLSHL